MPEAAAPLTPYDKFPYELTAFPQMHPGSLTAIGRLFGLTPADPRRCRVLELACGQGGSLLAMAESFPQSQFLGIDLSCRQIEEGRKLARSTGLTNLRLEVADIATVDLGGESFDLILCHGAFSWVAPAIRERILALCRQHLAPEGIAYISYNTHPGWQFRSLFRDIMRFYADREPDPKLKVGHGLAILKFVQESLPAAETPLRTIFREHLNLLHQQPANYLFHEYFSEEDQPLYFHQFMAQAERHGLRFLGESPPNQMSFLSMNQGRRAALGLVDDDVLRHEQYHDFLTNRSFRQTLLCHAEHPVLPRPLVRAFLGFYASIPLKAEEEAGEKSSFVTLNQVRATTTHPVTKAMLQALVRAGSFPVYLPAVLRQIRRQNPALALPEDFLDELGSLLGNLLLQGGGSFYTAIPRVTRRPSRCPRASQLARIMAGRGARVFTPFNRTTTLDPFSQYLLQYLDGANDRTTLAVLLGEDCRSGRFTLRPDGGENPGEEAQQKAIQAGVRKVLEQLNAQQLLVA